MNFFSKNEITVQEEVEKLLSYRLGQTVKIESSISLGGGCINHAAMITTNAGIFFLKWNANCAADVFLREAEGLAELKKAAGKFLKIPEVFVSKEVDTTPGFLVQEFLQPGYGGNNNQETLGKGLAVIHQYKNEKFGFYHHNYCGATLQNNDWTESWPVFFRDKRLGFLLQLIRKDRPLPVNEMKVYDRLLERINVLVPEGSVPVLIHGDLWSGNFMYTHDGPALIDPASCYTDREMEMSIMTMFGGFSERFFSAYNEINPLPKDWKERNRLYQLYHVLNHYYLFGGGYQNQALHIARYFVE